MPEQDAGNTREEIRNVDSSRRKGRQGGVNRTRKKERMKVKKQNLVLFVTKITRILIAYCERVISWFSDGIFKHTLEE